LKRAIPAGYVIKEDDNKFAYVTLVSIASIAIDCISIGYI